MEAVYGDREQQPNLVESGGGNVKNGATRAAQYSSEWGNVNLQEAINKFFLDIRKEVKAWIL